MADEIHPAEGTMAIHPDTLIDGQPAPAQATHEQIPLAVNEPVKPQLRRFVDQDPHGFKNKGLGDLSKLHSF